MSGIKILHGSRKHILIMQRITCYYSVIQALFSNPIKRISSAVYDNIKHRQRLSILFSKKIISNFCYRRGTGEIVINFCIPGCNNFDRRVYFIYLSSRQDIRKGEHSAKADVSHRVSCKINSAFFFLHIFKV